ncbi:MAG: TadE family protein, partial [Clostridiaceae bacterium]
MVETALVLPIIILIVFGIIEFGRILNTYIVLTNASREGA